jgi:hypothetical protein
MLRKFSGNQRCCVQPERKPLPPPYVWRPVLATNFTVEPVSDLPTSLMPSAIDSNINLFRLSCALHLRWRLPHFVLAMCRSRAATSISAELPSGHALTTRVRRRISRMICSSGLRANLSPLMTLAPFVDDFLASNCLLPRQVGFCLDERFYAWACRTPEPLARANARLLERIREIHEDNMGVIGAPRMQPDERRRPLRRQGGLRVLRAAQARTRKPSPVAATRRGAGGLVRLSRAGPKPENAS